MWKNTVDAALVEVGLLFLVRIQPPKNEAFVIIHKHE